MMCALCKDKEATVHLCQVEGDKTESLDLCEDCAKTKGLNDPKSISLEALLESLEDPTGDSLSKLLDRSDGSQEKP